ncbi:MAG: efflux RND transporter periplasmic adaptor subunit, partial [Planctomycetota bacterium]
MKHKMLVALLGLAAGLLVGFVLPSRWVFVKDPVRVSHEEGAAPGQFACPMFCVVMEALPEDGKCPVCGMELTVVTGESALSESDRRMIGLQVEVLGRLPLERSVRVVGEVDYDETRLSRITTRTAGWLQKVWADTTWTAVEKGGKLASIYAPELYQAQREYVDSLQAEGGNFDAFLQQAAERRLRLLGIGDEEIAALRSSRKVHDALILRAPRDGVIVEKNAVEGASVKEGELLYALADLSQVWVQAEVFEQDLVWVRPGQKVHLETAGRPERIVGRVAFIDPAIDRQSRTARVRIEVPNPKAGDGSRLLRIGQRVDATFRARLDEAGRPVTREPA